MLHKKVLKNAQELNERYHSKMMEVGILVDLHSWEYWIIEGTHEREVELKNNKEAYTHFLNANKNQLLFIHNHPSTGTFSGEDFKFFCNHEVFYMMTVVGNDGSVYVLNKTSAFDIRVLTEYTHLAASYYEKGYINNNGTMAIKTILKNARQYGLEYKKGSHR